MLEKYKTIYKEAQIEIIEKKSRFIASVKPVESEEDAQAFIEALRKKHYNANHNCFAYQIGERGQIQRQSDDGEPSGTAGMPMLDILRGENIKNAVVVVTRYFGGTLLGTGGLVRAYSRAAKEGLSAAHIIEKILYQMISVKTDYSLSGKVQYEILNNNHILHETLYTTDVEYIALVENLRAEAFTNSIRDLTSATVEIKFIRTAYCALVKDKVEIV